MYFLVIYMGIRKVDNKLGHTMYVKDRYVNDSFIYILTKWYQ